MRATDLKEAAELLYDNLRLKTFPVAVKFLESKADLPDKARQPSVALGHRVAICQGVTMARNYGWTVGLAREDVVCVPAAIVFGFSDAEDPTASLSELFCQIDFSSTRALAEKETATMARFEKGAIEAIVLSPLVKADSTPDTVLLYGNAAQIARLGQVFSYMTGERPSGEFGGKVDCGEYLIAPFMTQAPRVVIPGNGERVFAGTQDDELAFAFPAKFLEDLPDALRASGKAMGVRYPVTPYQNYQPVFPKAHREMGKKLGVL
ncbi:MAG: DUF169 domain-containing protein [Syntrophobacteraceae bacterium]